MKRILSIVMMMVVVIGGVTAAGAWAQVSADGTVEPGNLIISGSCLFDEWRGSRGIDNRRRDGLELRVAQHPHWHGGDRHPEDQRTRRHWARKLPVRGADEWRDRLGRYFSNDILHRLDC